MTEFHASDVLPEVPDDLTVAQFILDYHHHLRPIRPQGASWLIDDISGRTADYEEVSISIIWCIFAGNVDAHGENRSSGYAPMDSRMLCISDGTLVNDNAFSIMKLCIHMRTRRERRW